MLRPFGAAAAAFFVALFPVPPRAAAAEAASCPQVVAHRTNPLDAPENTVPGILATPATGSRMVEIDVRWTNTGFPVLMHDSTVDRTTNGTGPVENLGLGQTRALSAADYAPWRTDPRFGGFLTDGKPRTPVPYGYEFMDAVRTANVDLLIDVSGTPTQTGMEKLVVYVRDYFGWQHRTLFMGQPDKVRAMRGWYPNLRYAVIEYNPAEQIRRGESLHQLGVEAYAVPARDVTPAAVSYWRSYNVQVFTWTSDSAAIDTPTVWRQVADAGVDRLITDRPAEAIAFLACE